MPERRNAGSGRRFFQPMPLLARLLAMPLRPFTHQLRFSEECRTHLRLLGEKGHVVYVLRARSLLDYILLKIATIRQDLPAPHFANSLWPLAWLPVRSMWRRLTRRGQDERWRRPLSDDVSWLAAAATATPASVLFLRRRPPLWGRDALPDKPYIPALIELQPHLDRPIYLVPTLLLWEKRPRRLGRSLLDILFGPKDMPGPIRKLWVFLMHSHTAFFRIGEPINLQTDGPKLSGAAEPVLNKKVRRVLLHYLAREERVVQGPPLANRRSILTQIVLDPRAQSFIREEAESSGKAQEGIERHFRKCLDEIAANYTIDVIFFLEWFLRWVWRRIYEGMEVDEDGVEMVRQVSREASIVFVPCHKSHLDYLVLPYVLHQRSVSTPYVAAGDNLNLPVFGPILRRAGAFFLRRSFKGDRVYSMAFERYVTYLLKHQFFQLFYIEGTRSRTGKLMLPRYGMLGMILRAWLTGEARRMVFIPTAVVYESLVEGASYQKELTGAQKEKESVTGVLKSGKILGKRYGKVYVHFGEPIDPGSLFAPEIRERLRGEKGEGTGTTEALQRLAGRILDGINAATVITPSSLTALVMLTHPKRGIASAKLLGRANTLLDFLLESETPLASAFSDPEAALSGAAAMFLNNRLIEAVRFEGETIYSIVERSRIVLDFYKNNALHVFAPASLAASALLASLARNAGRQENYLGVEGYSVSVEEAATEYAFLRNILSEEFRFPQGEFSNRKSLLRTLDYFLKKDLLRLDSGGDRLRITARRDFFGRTSLKTLVLYSLLTYNFLEGYYLVLDSLGHLDEAPMDSKAFVDFVLRRGEQIYKVGNIIKREAILKVPLSNALAHFQRTGLVSVREADGKKRGRKSEALFLSSDQHQNRQAIMARMRGFFEYHKQRFLGI